MKIGPLCGCCVVGYINVLKMVGGKGLTAVQRKLGEYWRRREVRSIASGGIRLWNI